MSTLSLMHDAYALFHFSPVLHPPPSTAINSGDNNIIDRTPFSRPFSSALLSPFCLPHPCHLLSTTNTVQIYRTLLVASLSLLHTLSSSTGHTHHRYPPSSASSTSNLTTVVLRHSQHLFSLPHTPPKRTLNKLFK